MSQAIDGGAPGKRKRVPKENEARGREMGVERDVGELRGDVNGLLSRQQSSDASIIELFNQNRQMLKIFHDGQINAQRDRETLGRTLSDMITDSAKRQEERHEQLAQQLATQKGTFGTFRWMFDSLVLLCGGALAGIVTHFVR
jgi:hypothetical protein